MQTEFQHNQLPFQLRDKTHTTVDERLYEFLLLLRDLGVDTQYSCQGGGEQPAYVCADKETFYPVIRQLIAIHTMYPLLDEMFSEAVAIKGHAGICRYSQRAFLQGSTTVSHFKETIMSKTTITVKRQRKYGIIHFLFDCFMVVITCGFWLIWIFAREMRGR